jgi:hypothetical protein
MIKGDLQAEETNQHVKIQVTELYYYALKIFSFFLYGHSFIKVKKVYLKNFAECYTLVFISRGKHP